MPTARTLRLFERTGNHAIGVIDDVVITYAFRGSADDPRHVTASAEAVQIASARIKGQVRLLFIMQDATTSKPGSTAVRAEIGRVAKKFHDLVSHLVIVIVGQGFGVAVHRAIVSTLMILIRPSLPIKVVVDVESGLREIFGPGDACDEAVRLCETELGAPGRR